MAANNSNEGKNNLREWLIGTSEYPGLLRMKDLSVEAFAHKVGLRRATLYYYLEDKNRPSSESLAKMCHILGVSLQEGLKHVDPRAPGRPKSKAAAPAVTSRKRRLLSSLS
jgi:transcriptional regulator with XRE-family HTH domain